MSTVLVVDDKEMMRDSVSQTLKRAGFAVVQASDGSGALNTIARKRPDAVITDLKMPGMTGVELLDKIREIDDDLPVVVMTAFGTIQTAVDAMKRGAFDYVTKPFEGDELIIAIKRGLGHRRLTRENAVLRVVNEAATIEGAGPMGLDRLIGESDAMRRVKDQLSAVAASQGTVLVTGESGTGKEVVARAIHDVSPRGANPFLAVNCAALSESLLESELFGHERGAFTGAERLRKGRFELADGGTLLLDEVSEVSPTIQAKLLRVLQERAFERVGSSLTIGIDVRIVATSNRDLPAEVDDGRFRGDLFFRLNVLPIHLPALRERADDIEPLARHFVARVCAREGRATLDFESAALELMREYRWPGNVRELQNICERAVVLTRGDSPVTRSLIEPWLVGRSPRSAVSALLNRVTDIEAGTNGHANGNGRSNGNGHANGNGHTNGLSNGHPHAEPPEVVVRRDPTMLPPVRTLAEIERETIVETLHRFDGHRQRTARALGIGVRTLGLKLKKWKEERLVPESL
ncbi:MAG: sigma-54 dependent transcriptional regulator [Planctomycetota bacterium]